MNPPNGATITYKGNGEWDLDMATFGGMSRGDASNFVSARPFQQIDGLLFEGQQAIWSSAAQAFFATGSDGQPFSIEHPPAKTLAAAKPGHWEHKSGGWAWVNSAPFLPPGSPVPDPTEPPLPPANAGPGHYEHRPKGWVWVHDSVVDKVKDTMKTSAQQDIEHGYTFYLCPIDEYGKLGACATMTQAQAELAIATARATPVIAEDRKAGEIKPIDPFGKYGPRPTYPAGMLGPSALSISLNQWNAVQAAIAANPGASLPTPPPAQDGGSSESSVPEHIEKHVNLGVRILEGLAAIAGVFVAVKLWKKASR